MRAGRWIGSWERSASMVITRSGSGVWSRAALKPSLSAVPKPSFSPRSMRVMPSCSSWRPWIVSMVPSVLPSSMMIILGRGDPRVSLMASIRGLMVPDSLRVGMMMVRFGLSMAGTIESSACSYKI